jgi:integrase
MFSLYALRHTAATALMAAGVNPKIVAERLGHSGIAMTLRTYSHVSEGMQKEATAVVARLLGAKVGTAG